MRLFLIIVITVFSVPVFSQTPVADTSIKNLQHQSDVLSARIDSVRVIANARSEMLNRCSQHLGDLIVRLQRAREATIFDSNLFIDSMVHRMFLIFIGKADGTLKQIQLVIAFQQTLQKAATVYRPGQKELIDSLSIEYQAIDKTRHEAQLAFDEILIILDKYYWELDELKTKLSTKQKP